MPDSSPPFTPNDLAEGATEVTTAASPIEAPYAKCKDCGLDLADRDAMNTHLRETMAPTGEPGVTHRGHRALVVNPTEAEQRESRLRWLISDALDELYDRLDEEVRRERFTAEEISKAMWMSDLRDGWDEYAAEADDD